MGAFQQYKLSFMKGPRVRPTAPEQQIEDAILSSLTGSKEILARVQHVKATLGLHDSHEGRADYGCIHPRIEADMMMGAWSTVGMGQPPRLSDYLDGMRQFAELRRIPRFYVAVGSAISRKDNATLASHEEAESRWPQLIRSREPKPFHNRRGIVSNTSTYIASSLTDFLVCRDASVFIGWSGSAFASHVAYSAKLRNKHARWYSTCPRRMERLDRWHLGNKRAFACTTVDTSKEG